MLINSPWQRVLDQWNFLVREIFHTVEMENAPAIKTNEANLEELNKRIVEIKRKIVLKGESFSFTASRARAHATQQTSSLMTH